MKKRILLFLIGLMLLPIAVFAREEDLREMIFDVIGGKEHKLVIDDLKTVPLWALQGYDQEPDEEYWENYEVFNYIVYGYIRDKKEVRDILDEYEDENIRIDVYCHSFENCGIDVTWNHDQRGFTPIDDYTGEEEYPNADMTHFDVEIEVVKNFDTNVMKYVRNNFKADTNYFMPPAVPFYMYDMAFINEVYNMNLGGETALTPSFVRNPDLSLKLFPELKKIFDDEPSLRLVNGGMSPMGGSPAFNWDLVGAEYLTVFNDVVYKIQTVAFNTPAFILVPEDADDYEKAALERIKSYVNDSKIKVTLDPANPTLDSDTFDMMVEEINYHLDYLGYDEMDFTGDNPIYTLTLGNTKVYVALVPTSKENIKNYEIESFERRSGIKMISTSISVPTDATLEVDNVTSKYKNDRVISAYDISLYSLFMDDYIKNVKEGIKIMLPVADNFDVKNKMVAFIDNNGKELEKFDIKLETVDGKKYVVFTTTHLSTYAIIDNSVKNPNTVDTMGKVLIILILTTLIVVLFKSYRRRMA